MACAESGKNDSGECGTGEDRSCDRAGGVIYGKENEATQYMERKAVIKILLSVQGRHGAGCKGLRAGPGKRLLADSFLL